MLSKICKDNKVRTELVEGITGRAYPVRGIRERKSGPGRKRAKTWEQMGSVQAGLQGVVLHRGRGGTRLERYATGGPASPNDV